MDEGLGPPSVAIVVPVLDEAPTIAATLRRLRARFPECELVVVDGGSADDTVAAARPWATVLSSPRGRGTQLNRGARACTAEVLWFLHADTEPAPEAIDQLRAALCDPAVLGGGLTLRFDRRSRSLDLLARASNLRARRLHQVFGDQAMFVRRDAFEALGGFAEIPLMEDFEFTRRLARHGRLVVLPATCTASARRFQRHGTVRMVVFMQLLKLSFLAGVDPGRLERRYRAGPPRLLRVAPGRRGRSARVEGDPHRRGFPPGRRGSNAIREGPARG